ncbi:MAG: AsmA-like C-terminal region-containing protein [Nitrosomonadales bacterium]
MIRTRDSFLKIDAGGKLLSILSLQALPKRITLDFTDVFSNGFAFDSIKGTAQIKQGVLTSDNFSISGSSAKVTMLGQVGLEPRDAKPADSYFAHGRE